MARSAAHKLLRELIAVPSVNPSFLPHGDPRAGESRVAALLTDTVRRAGLDVETQTVFSGRSNLLLRLIPTGSVRQHILLAPHMDTVGGAEPLDSLFVPREKNGRLHGRGACDTKGSIAAMLTALLKLANSAQRPRHTAVTLAALVDEEDGQSGSRALAARGFKADLAIVGEPTGLRVVTAHKGDLWLRLETAGKSAHGARPELGRNAVHEMARIVDLLETRYATALKAKRHPLLGHATINVGTIHGGSQPNIVPDRCEISIDRRTIPGEDERTVRHEISAQLREANLKARIINTKNARCEPLETDSRLPLVRQLMRLANQSRPVGVDFFCDASVLSSGGIPSVVFGPGDIAQAHTADEWISLRSLEEGTELLFRFLQSLP